MGVASWSARLVPNLLLALGGAALALVVAEGSVRLFGIGSDQFLRPDPVLGVRFIPSKSGLSQGDCYRAPVTINDESWRSPEFAYADWARAWTITEGLIERVQSTAEDSGADFLAMGVASPIDVMPASILDRIVDADEVDVDGPSARLAAIGERHGFDVVSLVPAFRERIGASTDVFDSLFLDCDGHWTAEGHRLAADVVAPVVVRRIAARRP